MRMLDASRFQDADKYEAYLKTPSGRLRSELAWENLRGFLPSNTSKRRAGRGRWHRLCECATRPDGI